MEVNFLNLIAHTHTDWLLLRAGLGALARTVRKCVLDPAHLFFKKKYLALLASSSTDDVTLKALLAVCSNPTFLNFLLLSVGYQPTRANFFLFLFLYL
jgi:hypothetical protein